MQGPGCNTYSNKVVVVDVVQSPSCVWFFTTPWTVACQASLSLNISQSLPKFMSTESVMPSNLLILWHSLFLCLQSFPASGSFLMSWLFTSGDQNIGTSASASILAMSIQGWFPCCPRDSQESSPARQFKSSNSLVLCLLYDSALTTVCDYWKDHSLDHLYLCWQRFLTQSSFLLAFLPRSNHFPISWLQASSTVILEPKNRKSIAASTFSPSICHWAKCHDLFFF